jgi:two-component system, NtrC family, sensor kinase
MTPFRVLVVDDNTHIHRDFKRVVDTVTRSSSWSETTPDPLAAMASVPPPPADLEVCFAESGEKAIELVSAALAAREPFHIAFVDMRMPGMDGLATVEQLWQSQPDLEVAFSSAYMDYSWNQVIERLKRPGLRLVPKPWTGSKILAVLHELRRRVRDKSSRLPR